MGRGMFGIPHRSPLPPYLLLFSLVIVNGGEKNGLQRFPAVQKAPSEEHFGLFVGNSESLNPPLPQNIRSHLSESKTKLWECGAVGAGTWG